MNTASDHIGPMAGIVVAAEDAEPTNGFMSFYEANSTIIQIALAVVIASVITWILVRIARRLTKRVIAGAEASLERTAAGTDARRSKQQLLRRVRTMSTLVSNVIVWVQVAITAAVIFTILGVDVNAIFASAGVIAAVLTFSAQTLLKDIMTGLFLIAEDQVDIGDVVDVGFGLGVVESVSLRTTQVRAFDGFLWTVRNGEIVRTSNRTRGWLRLILEIDFTPESDIDVAKITVLRGLNEALAQHAEAHELQAAPSCWGLESFNGYGYRLKFLVEYTATAFDRLDSAMHEAAYRAIREQEGLGLACAPTSFTEVSLALEPPTLQE